MYHSHERVNTLVQVRQPRQRLDFLVTRVNAYSHFQILYINTNTLIPDNSVDTLISSYHRMNNNNQRLFVDSAMTSTFVCVAYI